MKSVASSFRDPAGSVFIRDGIVYRAIFEEYRKHYETLINSGLYQMLIEEKSLIPHEEVSTEKAFSEAYKIIRPQQLELISYPQEWCFLQLKEAALLTLNIQLTALQHGMVLKDASPYNIQFLNAQPILIDTLSFEQYNDGDPWIAYRQFCELFLAPLVVMSVKDIDLNLLRLYPQGVPLTLAVKMIPWRKRIKPSIYLNLVLHGRLQRRQGNLAMNTEPQKAKVSKRAMLGHTEMLIRAVQKLEPHKRQHGEWNTYYEENLLSNEYLKEKEFVIEGLLQQIKPGCVFDLGSNTGNFSSLASKYAREVIALEKDAMCSELFAQKVKKDGVKNIMPLLFDIMEPLSTAGWESSERLTLWQRQRSDLVMALAVLHHISIGENVPYEKISSLFLKLGRQLLIEFVAPDDPNAKRLLRYKSSLMNRISKADFIKAFEHDWKIVGEFSLKSARRTIYHMTARNDE